MNKQLTEIFKTIFTRIFPKVIKFMDKFEKI